MCRLSGHVKRTPNRERGAIEALSIRRRLECEEYRNIKLIKCKKMPFDTFPPRYSGRDFCLLSTVALEKKSPKQKMTFNKKGHANSTGEFSVSLHPGRRGFFQSSVFSDPAVCLHV